MSLNGSGTVDLEAPNSGTDEAMLFIGDRSVASGVGSTVTGTTTTKFSGVIYLPKEALTYTGGSTMSKYTTIIADTLKMTGLTYIQSDYSNLSSGNPISNPTVELIQ